MADPQRNFNAHLVTEAFADWLWNQGAAPEPVPLQQLFSLCHAAVIPRQLRMAGQAHQDAAQPAPPAAAQLIPLFGTALVRLLDGCLSSAASLPDPHHRHIATSNVLSAFCRSALREAQLRAAAAAADHAAGAAGTHLDSAGIFATLGPPSVSSIDMDTEFLDGCFAVLAAVAQRHPRLCHEVQLMETAWGSCEGKPGTVQSPRPGQGPAEAGVSGAAAAAAGTLSHGGSGSGGPAPATEAAPDTGSTAAPGSVLTAEHVADFFLDDIFQCKLAAGQMLFAAPDGHNCAGPDGSAALPRGTMPGGLGAAGLPDPDGDPDGVLASLCEVPALADLCAAAAAAAFWPDLVACVAEGGPEALVRWLAASPGTGAGVDAGFQSAAGGAPPCMTADDTVISMQCGGGGGDGSRSVAMDAGPVRLLVAALGRCPGEVVAGVPPELWAVLALRHGGVLRALLGAVAQGLAGRGTAGREHCADVQYPCDSASVVRAVGAQGGLAGVDVRVGMDDWQTGAEAGWGRLGPGSGGTWGREALHPCVRRLHECFTAVGWDLGELLQQHLQGQQQGR